jgi:hypothetical protein
MPGRLEGGTTDMLTNKKTVTWRSEAHADIADTLPFRKSVTAMTESNFAQALLKELRERGGGGVVQELREEWLNTGDGGKVYEISAEVADLPL